MEPHVPQWSNNACLVSYAPQAVAKATSNVPLSQTMGSTLSTATTNPAAQPLGSFASVSQASEAGDDSAAQYSRELPQVFATAPSTSSLGPQHMSLGTIVTAPSQSALSAWAPGTARSSVTDSTMMPQPSFARVSTNTSVGLGAPTAASAAASPGAGGGAFTARGGLGAGNGQIAASLAALQRRGGAAGPVQLTDAKMLEMLASPPPALSAQK